MAASIGSISNAVTSLTQYAPRDLFLDFVKRPLFLKEVVKGQVSISLTLCPIDRGTREPLCIWQDWKTRYHDPSLQGGAFAHSMLKNVRCGG